MLSLIFCFLACETKQSSYGVSFLAEIFKIFYEESLRLNEVKKLSFWKKVLKNLRIVTDPMGFACCLAKDVSNVLLIVKELSNCRNRRNFKVKSF